MSSLTLVEKQRESVAAFLEEVARKVRAGGDISDRVVVIAAARQGEHESVEFWTGPGVRTINDFVSLVELAKFSYLLNA